MAKASPRAFVKMVDHISKEAVLEALQCNGDVGRKAAERDGDRCAVRRGGVVVGGGVHVFVVLAVRGASGRRRGGDRLAGVGGSGSHHGVAT